jgi:hypothetical protein
MITVILKSIKSLAFIEHQMGSTTMDALHLSVKYDIILIHKHTEFPTMAPFYLKHPVPFTVIVRK